MFGNLFNQKKREDQVNQPSNQEPPAQNPQPYSATPTGQQAFAQNTAPTGQPVQQAPPQGQQPQATPAPSPNNPAARPDMSALSHLDPRASVVLTHAQEEARRIKQQFIEPDQLLFGLLTDESIYKLLEESQVDGGQISKEIQAKEKIGVYRGQPTLSKISQQIFDQAYKDAKMRGSNFVTPEDLFIVLFNPTFGAVSYLESKGLKKEAVIDKISKNPNLNYSRKTVLEKYGIDLTQEARDGKLDPVAGRDKEIDRIIHILLRRTKNNPIIIGETGVGKTAIVEGLAQKIVAGQVPKDLQDKRLFQLDVASLIAGASHRGEFEERMREVINEVLGSNNKIVLFIDEIHALMGTGEGEGMNAANIIKPHLARGHLQLIGATTTVEYRKNFEKDKAFERRFQPVTAEEPSEENAFEMLKVLRPKYEKFHRVTIPDDALMESVKLSKKYIGERYLPDKAVDLLDESSSDVKLQVDEGKRGDNQVKKGDIERVVSGWTGIPITKLTEDESEKLLKLEDRIHKRLIDQEEAVVAVSEAVRRGRIGLAAANRPIASFVFLGPTGVGKTELAKTLAELLFGRDDAMARLDMSEYMEKHEVAKLIGAPPGYVGYEEGGQLTEAVRKKPYSIVLLDEIEKAHPDVFNILLQLLEDGRLTDNKGNIISFKNTIVICTSNIGSSLIQQQLSKEDPKVKKTNEQFNKSFKELTSIVKEELIKFFRPELLNRFDEVVIFKPLRPEHMAGIARLGIAKTAALLKEQGYNLQITERAITKLATDGYDPVYGARPLRRLIQTAIENPIALAIISKKFTTGDTIVIDYNDDTNEFFFTKGGQAQTSASLSDEQFKEILQKIANPETVLNESDRQPYTTIHDKVMKASAEGNKTANAILSVTAATSQTEIQTIRQELEAESKKDIDWAKEILDLATTVAGQVQAANNFKLALLKLINPSEINDLDKKEKFTRLHDKLSQESQQGNQLATTILAVTKTTSSEVISKIMSDLTQAKNQENELATDILSLVNIEIAQQAEQAHNAEPTTKFKNMLQQVINPLYLAAPENKDKFNKLYDKISSANQQNHQLAGSILSITDITSDLDIQQLKEQLEQAKTQGDPLAIEILETIDAAIKHEAVRDLKNTLLLIVNPVTAHTPRDREKFTSIREKVSQAGQQGNQLANELLSITDTVSDDNLRQLKEQLEKARGEKDEVAILVLGAMSDQGDANAGAPQNPDQTYPFGMGQNDQQSQLQTPGTPNQTGPVQTATTPIVQTPNNPISPPPTTGAQMNPGSTGMNILSGNTAIQDQGSFSSGVQETPPPVVPPANTGSIFQPPVQNMGGSSSIDNQMMGGAVSSAALKPEEE